MSKQIFFNVYDFGALGDGTTLDTAAAQHAIEAAARAGGGTVLFPAGQFVIGAVFLRNNITLHLEAGAILLGSEDENDYPLIRSRWEGAEQETHASLITGEGLHHIALTGRGIIDGRGAHWWLKHKSNRLQSPRPRLIGLRHCENILIEGITLINSPSWTINPVRCENITIEKVTIKNPPDSPNTDGINPDSCRYVHIANCHIDVGDDCITIKSGTEKGEAAERAPCEDITITNCTMVHGHGGVVIGSEMSGDVRRVTISNCVFVDTDRGLRIKSRRGRGGVVEDIRATNLIMQNVLCPFTMNLYYAPGARGNKYVSSKEAQPVNEGTPRLQRIHYSHITVRDAHYAAGFIYGLPEMPVTDISLHDISIHMANNAQRGEPDMAEEIEELQGAGFFVRHARSVQIQNVEITNQRGEAWLIEEAEVRGV